MLHEKAERCTKARIQSIITSRLKGKLKCKAFQWILIWFASF